jgi:hypothetical protein
MIIGGGSSGTSGGILGGIIQYKVSIILVK